MRSLLCLTLLLAGCAVDPPAGDDDATAAPDDDDAAADDDDSAAPDDDDAAGDDDDDAGDDDDAAPHEYECVPIGASDADGFFALRSFGGRLYAGQFGYGHEGASMLYRTDPWELVSPGLLGVTESVCAMREFDGMLYANTESSGDVFRSADGSTWERVYDGPGSTIGCGLEVFGGALYAVQYGNQAQEHGVILRSANGTDWETVWDSGAGPVYLREIVGHEGTLYAWAINEDDDNTVQLASTDGTSWSVTATPTRFFRGLSHDGELWIGATERGGHSTGGTGIWRLDAGGPTLVHAVDAAYVTELAAWDGALWAGTSDGWKYDVGNAQLLRSDDGDGSWENVCTFSELAAWSIAVNGDHLYVGTWEYEVGGSVYEVRIVEP